MKRFRILLLGLAAGLTAAGPTLADPVPVSPAITAGLASHDRVTLIVGLVPPDIDPASGDTALRQAIHDRQQAVIDAVGAGILVDTRYAAVPVLAVQATRDGLAALQAHPLVVSIAPNRRFGPADAPSRGELALAPRPIDPIRAAGLPVASLTAPAPAGRASTQPQAARPPAPTATSRLAQPDNLRVIGAPAVWSAGHVGAGQFVAVLDTGVDTAHPAFAGKTVIEACFSGHDPARLSFSLCPGRAGAAIGPGTASNCPETDLVPSCVHGTHVAGIATGNDPVAGVYGVAPQADVIAIQVFHRGWDAKAQAWSIGSDTIDFLAGLDQVASLAQANPGRIAAANMSLGGGRIGRFCDADLAGDTEDDGADSLLVVLNRLRDLNVTTAIAAGNDDYRGELAFPACLSPAIAVAATTPTDVFSDNAGTNLAAFPLVFVAAPGDLVLSAIPGGRYARFSGTSMATPMVAGALAVLHAAYPGHRTFDYETALARSGKPLVLDGRYRLPRLDLTAADAMLAGNLAIGSLSGSYQPSSPVSYVQSPAYGNQAWSWYKHQLYVP